MSARMTILLGAGGVGKTTLAAGYAIALARAGARVGLLGIDPARRLESALGLALDDRAVRVPGESLDAALLSPRESLLRWASESSPDDAARARILHNPFFVALSDRLATATDVLAAVRVAEWAERDPALTDLVVDTAPGLGALDFVRRPESLAAFLDGALVAGLRRLARSRGARDDRLRGSRRVLGALSSLGGAHLLLELAEFLAQIEAPLGRMIERLAAARAWLASDRTRIVLVTTVRDDAAKTARAIAEALRAYDLSPRAVVLNRAVSPALGEELAALPDATLPAGAIPLARYARTYAAVQSRVAVAVRSLAPTFVAVREARAADAATRLDTLAALGEALRARLA